MERAEAGRTRWRLSDFLPPSAERQQGEQLMTIRAFAIGGVIATALLLTACHEGETATNGVNAAAELANG